MVKKKERAREFQREKLLSILFTQSKRDVTQKTYLTFPFAFIFVCAFAFAAFAATLADDVCIARAAAATAPDRAAALPVVLHRPGCPLRLPHRTSFVQIMKPTAAATTAVEAALGALVTSTQ